MSIYQPSSRFSSIAWSKMKMNNAGYPLGIIAGGMSDGNVRLWNPSKLAAGEAPAGASASAEPLLATIAQHQGSVNGLQFNPNAESSHLLASGHTPLTPNKSHSLAQSFTLTHFFTHSYITAYAPILSTMRVQAVPTERSS